MSNDISAFPWGGDVVGGMTLRDYFAAKAMQGELAAQSPELGEYTDTCIDMLAKRSYAIADAMLKAREMKG